MKDKVNLNDQVTIMLNGKPVTNQHICAICGIDKTKQPCPKIDQNQCTFKQTK